MDWKPGEIVAVQCKVKQSVAEAANFFFDKQWSIPYIHRSFEVDGASFDLLREMKARFDVLECVSTKVRRILAADDIKHAARLDKKAGFEHSSTLEYLLLWPMTSESSPFPEDIRNLLRQCTTLEEVSELMFFFRHTASEERKQQNDVQHVCGNGTRSLAQLFWGREKHSITKDDVDQCFSTDNIRKTWEVFTVLESFKSVSSKAIAWLPTTFHIVKDLCLLFPPLLKSKRLETGALPSASHLRPSDAHETFARYFDFTARLTSLDYNHLLDINRGVSLNILDVTVEFSEIFAAMLKQRLEASLTKLKNGISEPFLFPSADDTAREWIDATLNEAWTRWIKPRLAHRLLAEAAREARYVAMKRLARYVLAKHTTRPVVIVVALLYDSNLRSNLLLVPRLPASDKYVLGLYPERFPEACSWAVVSISTNEIVAAGVLSSSTARSEAISGDTKIKMLQNVFRSYSISDVATGYGAGLSKPNEDATLKLIHTFASSDHTLVGKRTRSEMETPEKRYNFKVTPITAQGLAVWSVSPQAVSDLPDVTAIQRCAVAIARRLIRESLQNYTTTPFPVLRHQNPLNEYTKLEPHWFSLGQSQYDIPKGDLHGVLESVVQECVSCVGVDVNTAEAHLLRYIPGFDTVKAEAVVKYRKTNGPFITRHQLLQVEEIQPDTFKQAAGFLMVCMKTRSTTAVENAIVSDEDNPGREKKLRKKEQDDDAKTFTLTSSINPNVLDATTIHPEHYAVAEALIRNANATLDPKEFGTLHFRDQILQAHPLPDTNMFLQSLAGQYKVDIFIIKFILEQLTNVSEEAKKGAVMTNASPLSPLPRRLRFEDLELQQRKTGYIKKVTPFGVFIDINAEQDGFLPLNTAFSDNRKISNGKPLDVVIIALDPARRQITLSMDHSTERRDTAPPYRHKYTREERRQALEAVKNSSRGEENS